ncbi:MAG: hypothetical protein JSW33_04520 [bacterium]|nr:MAG: hypothetical protein JSW33_04520 [bacterium]
MLIGIVVLILLLFGYIIFEEIFGDKLRWIYPTIFGLMIFQDILKTGTELEIYLAAGIIFVLQISWILYLQKKESEKKE